MKKLIIIIVFLCSGYFATAQQNYPFNVTFEGWGTLGSSGLILNGSDSLVDSDAIFDYITALGITAITNNQVVTGTGTGIQGEPNMTFDGTDLTLNTSHIIITGTGNSVFIGSNAGTNDDLSTNNNVAVGYAALEDNVIRSNNTAVGSTSLVDLITGGNVSAFGSESGKFFGSFGGSNITSATNSLFLGARTVASANGNTNEIVIGFAAVGQGSNTVTLGDDNITDIYMSEDTGATVHATIMELGANGTASGQINFIASDNDQGNVAITTGDDLVYSGFEMFGYGTTDPDDYITMISSTPVLTLTDSDINLNTSTSPQQQDTAAIILKASDASIWMAAINGEVVNIRGTTNNALAVEGAAFAELYLDTALVQFPENYDQGPVSTVRKIEYVVHDTVHHDNAAWHPLYLNGLAAAMDMPVGAGWMFHILVMGVNSGITENFSYEITGSIVKAGVGVAVLKNSTVTDGDESDVNFDARVVATGAALVVEVQDSGGTGDIIQWNAVVTISEAQYDNP